MTLHFSSYEINACKVKTVPRLYQLHVQMYLLLQVKENNLVPTVISPFLKPGENLPKNEDEMGFL